MKRKDLAVYPALFELDEGTYTITFPDLPGCISCADTEAEAVLMARDALGAWLVTNEDMGNPAPQATLIADVKTKAGQSVCLIDAWLPIFREESRSGSVKKSLTVPVWLNSLAEKQGINFSQVLQAGLKAALGVQHR